MNCHKKKVLALIGAIANLTFSFGVAGAATLAWYNSNKVTHSNNISIQSVSRSLVIDEYTILKYDDDLKAGVSYVNDSTQFILPDYDQYIKARNVYSNIVIRAELSFPKGLDTTNKAVEIDILKLATSTLKDEDGIRLLTSNVAQFQCIATQYTPQNSDTPVSIAVGISENQGSYKSVDDAMYRTSIAYFASRKTPTTFISLMNGQPVDPDNGNRITLVPELYNVGTIKHSIIYIECSYNEKLVDGFVEDHPDEPIHNLEGDITNINFFIRDFTDNPFGQNSTGQYIRMNDVGGSYSGQYLSSYVGDSDNRILDGSLSSGDETVGEASGINSSDNLIGVNDYIRSDKSKMYSSDQIDHASLAYDRGNGTYKTSNNHYVGNNSDTNGIVSSSTADGLQNTLAYNGYDADVRPVSHNTMKMQYDSSDSKIAYYGASKNPVSLYRYHENDIVSASLTGFTVTGPTGEQAIYSVGAYFSLKGVSCVATYTKPDNTTFTLNVSSVCTYTTTGEGTLIPDKTIFTNIGSPKTINVTYTDRGVTMNGSFNITVLADVLEFIEVTSLPNKTTFVKGEAFDLTGLVVTGHFATVGDLDVTSDCLFKINGSYYSNNQILNISGNNLIVTVEYNGGATKGEFYRDKTFTISINNYIIDIDSTNEVIAVGNSITLSFSFNGNVDWSITGTTGSLSFSSSDATATTSTTTYTGSDFANQSGTITVYGLAAGTSTVTATINGTSIKDTCIIRVTDGSEVYATYTITSTSAVTASDDVPSGSTATYSSTYNTKYQLTNGNSMTLTLSGYTGYKITGIILSMRSNASGGAGHFEATVGGSTVISSIANASFNDASWNGAWSTSYVNIEPSVSVQKTVSNGEDVQLVITSTANSIYCQSYTIYYEQGEVASVQSLTIKDGDVILNSSSKDITSGVIGMKWTPTAVVTYTDSTTNNSVVWSIVSGQSNNNITIDPSSGQITLNTASGTAVIKATTTGMDSGGNNVTAQFTLNWSNLTKVLDSITLDTTNVTKTFDVGDTFTYAGLVVTANYTDGTHATIASGYTVSTPNMSTPGTKTVTVTYTEGGVEKEAEYTITVNGSGNTSTYTIVFTTNASDSSTAVTASNFLTGSAVDTNTLVGSISDTSRCYAGKNGLKFGTGSYAGSFTAVPVAAAQSNVLSISLVFSAYGSDTGDLVLSVNDTTIKNDIDPSTGTYTYEPASAIASVTSFGVATTANRAYLASVTFTVEGGSTPPPTPTLTSIAVKNEPTTTTYTAGDYFNPAGLVITLTYSDNSKVDVTYAGHENDFTFTPGLTTALATTDTQVTIGYGGQTCTQAITVTSGGTPPPTPTYITFTINLKAKALMDATSYQNNQTTNNYVGATVNEVDITATLAWGNINPNNGQIRGNDKTAGNNFYIYNTTALGGNIRSITITEISGTVVPGNIYAMTGAASISSRDTVTSSGTAGTSGTNSVTWTFTGNSGGYFALFTVKGFTSGNVYATSIVIVYEVPAS